MSNPQTIGSIVMGVLPAQKQPRTDGMEDLVHGIRNQNKPNDLRRHLDSLEHEGVTKISGVHVRDGLFGILNDTEMTLVELDGEHYSNFQDYVTGLQLYMHERCGVVFPHDLIEREITRRMHVRDMRFLKFRKNRGENKKVVERREFLERCVKVAATEGEKKFLADLVDIAEELEKCRREL